MTWLKAGCCSSLLVIQLKTSIPASSWPPISPRGSRVCSKIKQLGFVVACAQGEWLGSRGICVPAIRAWALPLLNPIGISQLQPSVQGVSWAHVKHSRLLLLITTPYFRLRFWKASGIVGPGWLRDHCSLLPRFYPLLPRAPATVVYACRRKRLPVCR